MHHPETIRIKSTHPASQGDFVEINKTDFDPEKHQLFDESPVKKMTIDEIRQALTEKGIAFEEKAKKADLLALLESAA